MTLSICIVIATILKRNKANASLRRKKSGTEKTKNLTTKLKLFICTGKFPIQKHFTVYGKLIFIARDGNASIVIVFRIKRGFALLRVCNEHCTFNI